MSSISWAVRAFCHHTLQATTGQAVFGRNMISNLSPIIYWIVSTVTKQ